MKEITTEMNYCRRCGTPITHQEKHAYRCENGHTIFRSAAPSTALFLVNDRHELAVITRSIEPGRGQLDIPGGFCDGEETLIEAVQREVQEEIGVNPNQYTKPEFIDSGIDPYDYDGETVAALATSFTANTKGSVTLTPGDDAETASFKPLNSINEDDIFFPSQRKAFKKLVEKQK